MYFPSINIIEHRMRLLDTYEFFVGGKPCQIWLDKRGMFHGQVADGSTFNGFELDDVILKMKAQFNGKL